MKEDERLLQEIKINSTDENEDLFEEDYYLEPIQANLM